MYWVHAYIIQYCDSDYKLSAVKDSLVYYICSEVLACSATAANCRQFLPVLYTFHYNTIPLIQTIIIPDG